MRLTRKLNFGGTSNGLLCAVGTEVDETRGASLALAVEPAVDNEAPADAVDPDTATVAVTLDEAVGTADEVLPEGAVAALTFF